MTTSAPVPFDRIAARYDETRGGEPRGLQIADDVAPWLVPGPVLEVGVGTGVVASALAARGVPVSGVDLSPDMLVRARARLGAKVALGDACHLPISSSTVDNVLFVWVLHLTGDVPTTLAEAARVVRPGGRVIAVHGGQVSELTDIDAELDRVRPAPSARPDEPDTVAAAATAAGLTLVHQGSTTAQRLSRTPNEMAALVEQRVWSYLWCYDEREFHERVVPAIEALRALPDPDRPRTVDTSQHLTAYTRRP